MSYNSELAQDMINFVSYMTSKRDYEISQLVDLLRKEFANDKGMTWSTGEDPIAQYPEETEDAFDAAGMYRVFLDWRKQTLGESKTMKITKRQLRRIIREAMQPGGMAVRLQTDKLVKAGLADFAGPIEYKRPQNFVIKDVEKSKVPEFIEWIEEIDSMMQQELPGSAPHLVDLHYGV